MSPDDRSPSTESPGDQSQENLEALLAEAQRLGESGRYDEAAEQLKYAAEEHPDSPLPRYNLSVVYLMQLREDYEHLEVWEDLADDEHVYEAAVAEAEAALEIDAEFVPARNNLGRLFALKGWWADAAREWETSLSIDPGQPQLRQDLQEARRKMD